MNTLQLFTVTFAIASTAILTSCSRQPVVAEGIILSVEYQLENGKTGGFTRLNNSKAVPSGNGAWNIDAYGRLTKDFLIITRPQRKDLGAEAIPVHRLVDVRFGDGGIQQVDEGHPKNDE